jgi:hypothetical protein
MRPAGIALLLLLEVWLLSLLPPLPLEMVDDGSSIAIAG